MGFNLRWISYVLDPTHGPQRSRVAGAIKAIELQAGPASARRRNADSRGGGDGQAGGRAGDDQRGTAEDPVAVAAAAARASYERGNYDEAWRHIHTAQLRLLDNATDAEKKAAAFHLRELANTRLDDSTRAELKDLTVRDDLSPEELAKGFEIAFEYLEKQYQQARTIAHYIHLLSAGLVILLVSFGIGIHRDVFDSDKEKEGRLELRTIGVVVGIATDADTVDVVRPALGVPETFVDVVGTECPIWEDLSRFLLVLMVGALGAAISTGISIVPEMTSKSAIPDLLRAGNFVIARPILGAASAVAIVTLLDAGLSDAFGLDGQKVVGAALIAGFSDRLLLRAVEGVVGK